MFRWADHVESDHVHRVRDAFDELATLVTVRQHAHGTDVGVAEGTFDYLVVADFDTVADWRSYRDHPAHVLLVEELITGHVSDRATGQFHVPDERSPHDVSATRMHAFLAEPDASDDGSIRADASDEELISRARRAAMAELQALLAEPDDGAVTSPTPPDAKTSPSRPRTAEDGRSADR